MSVKQLKQKETKKEMKKYSKKGQTCIKKLLLYLSLIRKTLIKNKVNGT